MYRVINFHLLSFKIFTLRVYKGNVWEVRYFITKYFSQKETRGGPSFIRKDFYQRSLVPITINTFESDVLLPEFNEVILFQVDDFFSRLVDTLSTSGAPWPVHGETFRVKVTVKGQWRKKDPEEGLESPWSCRTDPMEINTKLLC